MIVELRAAERGQRKLIMVARLFRFTTSLCRSSRILISPSCTRSIPSLAPKRFTRALHKTTIISTAFCSCIIYASSLTEGSAEENKKDPEATLVEIKSDSSNMSELVDQVEALYSEHRFKETYELLLPHKDCDDPEVLWRFVRASRDRATMDEVGKDEKKKIIFAAFDVATRAVKLGDNNYACHKWYGIMLSQTGDYNGTKNKIENSPAMRKHFERAIELNPSDSTSQHLMGMWCFSFADLAWYERKIAAVVFGSPPESTYEEALAFFEKSEQLGPGAYSTNMLMIATVYLRMGKKTEAKEWFQKLANYTVIRDEDKQNVKKANDQLKSL